MKLLRVAACFVPVSLLFAAPARAVSSAEFYQPLPAFYGRFEARLRFAPGDGVVSSFFLWKAGSEMSGAYWNELDFEKLGADCHVQTNAIFGAPNVGHPQTNALTGDACGEYHTYGFEWAPSYIAWQIDGAEVRRETGATATAFAQNASAGMEIHFNIWPGDATFGGVFSPAILPVHQYVSWVRYSSFENGSFSPKWREDLDAASVPSGWATGNWPSPKGLSTHSPGNVNFADGISILSLTSDDAMGFTGMPPRDAVSGSSGAGSGSSGGTNAGTGGALSGTAGQSAGTAGAGTGGIHSGGSAGATQGATDSGSGNDATNGASAAGSGATRAEPTSNGSASCGCHLPMNGRSSAPGALALAALSLRAGRRRARHR